EVRFIQKLSVKQDLGNTRHISLSEDLMNSGSTQITVDEQCLVAGLGHRNCHPTGDRRLPLARPRTGNQKPAVGMIGSRKGDVRTQNARSISQGAHGSLVNEQFQWALKRRRLRNPTVTFALT